MQVRVRTLTMIDSVFPRALARDIFLVLYFAGLTAFGAQLAFHVGPVPITGQTFIVLLAGALLGSKRGALSQISYLAMGAMGAPIFAGGLGGPAVFFGPTAGYLVGFVGAAFLVGLLAERGFDRRVWSTALAMIMGSVVIYAFGLTWLHVWLSRFSSESSVLAVGLYPFLAGDAVKVALASVALPGGWALLNRLPH
jgi:biotin transporter BioY